MPEKRRIARIARWFTRWESWRRIFEVIVAAGTLGAAVAAAVAANLAADAAEDARTQIRSEVGSAEPYLGLIGIELVNSDNSERAPNAVVLTVQNTGRHVASGVNITFAIVNKTRLEVAYLASQDSSIDLVGGRDARASFGSLTGAVLDGSYFIVRFRYDDPVLGNSHEQRPFCLAYETSAWQPSGVGTIPCGNAVYSDVLRAMSEDPRWQ